MVRGKVLWKISHVDKRKAPSNPFLVIRDSFKTNGH